MKNVNISERFTELHWILYVSMHYYFYFKFNSVVVFLKNCVLNAERSPYITVRYLLCYRDRLLHIMYVYVMVYIYIHIALVSGLQQSLKYMILSYQSNNCAPFLSVWTHDGDAVSTDRRVMIVHQNLSLDSKTFIQ